VNNEPFPEAPPQRPDEKWCNQQAHSIPAQLDFDYLSGLPDLVG
jgi:hypothetical protein